MKELSQEQLSKLIAEIQSSNSLILNYCLVFVRHGNYDDFDMIRSHAGSLLSLSDGPGKGLRGYIAKVEARPELGDLPADLQMRRKKILNFFDRVARSITETENSEQLELIQDAISGITQRMTAAESLSKLSPYVGLGSHLVYMCEDYELKTKDNCEEVLEYLKFLKKCNELPYEKIVSNGQKYLDKLQEKIEKYESVNDNLSTDYPHP